MVWPSSPRKSAGVVAAVFAAALLFAPAGYAQSGSLGLEQTAPVIAFDFDGRVRYTGDVLEVDATPLFAHVVDFLPPAPISDFVDGNGNPVPEELRDPGPRGQRRQSARWQQYPGRRTTSSSRVTPSGPGPISKESC